MKSTSATYYLDGRLSTVRRTIPIYNQPPRSTQPSIPLRKINQLWACMAGGKEWHGHLW